MRWLFVSDFLPEESSGAAGSLIAIARALEHLGHRVDFEWKDPRPHRIPHATAARLLELGRRQRRQVEARLAAQSYDVVTVSQPFAYSVFERVAPRFPGTLFLNRTHGWEARLYEAQRRFAWDGRTSPGLAARVSAALTQRACRRAAQSAAGVIAASTRCAEWIRARYQLPADRAVAIPYGLDATDAAAHRPRSGDRIRLLYVGNYLPLKGSSVLEAVLPNIGRRFPTVTLTLVVDRASRDEAHERFRPVFGERVTVESWLERRHLMERYASHDVFLFPSLFEGFGKAWLEAMAFGLCVVGFDEGGLRDVARHGEEALYCAAGDGGALERLLAQVLESPEQAFQIGERARARVQSFTWERTARETAAFAERLRAGR
ncbi:MAG TPA: glycosyltransferase family 4 protein [Gemmatimonadales bacterium]|nr:glycosyltransferase family 4 protein [Gemmatimonadales bacterium]